MEVSTAVHHSGLSDKAKLLTKKIPASTLSLSTCIHYGLPTILFVFLSTPTYILQGIYAKYYGISLTSIAGIILLARIFDAITDPLIGVFSDRYQQKNGTRKPFMFFGGLLFIIGGLSLYSPWAEPTAFYFCFWLLVFYLGWTLYEIPHLSWGSEIAPSTTDKNRIYGVRTALGYVGLLGFYCIPLLPWFETREITPETLRWCGIVTAILLLPIMYFSLRRVPDGETALLSAVDGHQLPQVSRSDRLRLLLKPYITNKPLMLYLGVFIFSGMSNGMWYGLIFIYVDVYLGLGELFAEMFLYAFIVGLISTPIWTYLANGIGKILTWAAAILLLLASFIYTGSLEYGAVDFYQLLILKSLNTLGFVGLTIMIYSVLSDIVDYSILKYRIPSVAKYFALLTFCYKFVFAIGGAASLAIAGWYGFDASSDLQSTDGIYGLMVGIFWIPCVFSLVSLILVFFTPLTPQRHKIVQNRLEALAKRSEPK